MASWAPSRSAARTEGEAVPLGARMRFTTAVPSRSIRLVSVTFLPEPMRMTPSAEWSCSVRRNAASRWGSASVMQSSTWYPSAAARRWTTSATVWNEALIRLLSTSPMSLDCRVRNALAAQLGR